MGITLAIVISYFIGALPFGFILGKIVHGVDVRAYGSGRTGMTNVLRSAGVKVAIVVLALDVSKGVFAVVVARMLTDSDAVEVASAITTIIGHNWSIFLRFTGGRGTATGFGGLILMAYPANIIAVVVALPVIAISRYVSLGSIIGTSVAAISTVVLAMTGYVSPVYSTYPLIGGFIIVVQHRQNIQRLWNGNELKIGRKATEIDVGFVKSSGN
jgi:glycerol-3-phosphate acyltransferase PlsY